MKEILILIDMQNDFISGVLGSKEAQKIVPLVAEKAQKYPKECIFATQDTHDKNYLSTQEGKKLPVEHCIKGTDGWKIHEEIAKYILAENIVEKSTFGSFALAERIAKIAENEEIKIELCGLCTDICVISNALILKARLPETHISVDSYCCAGSNLENHIAATLTMLNCQISVH